MSAYSFTSTSLKSTIKSISLLESKSEVKITDSLTARRAHSDYITFFPNDLLEILITNKIDLDIEAKMKEQAVFRLYKIYNMFNVKDKYVV